jgi:hypothetical protein
MNPFEMVVAIVFITAIASVLRARYGIRRDKHGNDLPVERDTGAAQRMEAEMKQLKWRKKTASSARSNGCGIGRDDEYGDGRGSGMSSGQIMAVIIVAMVLVAGIFKSRFRYAHKYGQRLSEGESRAAMAEAERLREEVKQLKERLHVLERITVEKESSLEREFARLRDQ